MSDIVVVDEFFPKLQQRFLEVATLDRDLSWNYKHNPEYGDPMIDHSFRKNDKDIISLNFGIFRHAVIQDEKIVSSLYESHLYNLKSLIEQKFNVEVESFKRMFFV